MKEIFSIPGYCPAEDKTIKLDIPYHASKNLQDTVYIKAVNECPSYKNRTCDKCPIWDDAPENIQG